MRIIVIEGADALALAFPPHHNAHVIARNVARTNEASARGVEAVNAWLADTIAAIRAERVQ